MNQNGWHPYADLLRATGVGRKPSNSPQERFFIFYTYLRNSVLQRVVSHSSRFSLGRTSIEIEHCVWACMSACVHNGAFSWPTQNQLHALWNQAPETIKTTLGRPCPLAIDTTFRPFPCGPMPKNLSDYYNGKPNVRGHVLGNLVICDLRGRLCWVSNGIYIQRTLQAQMFHYVQISA